ncbi:MAG: nuclease A inhibitor family protein [Nostoc sp.]
MFLHIWDAPKQAVSGVFYTSESDYPFEAVHWKIGE